MQLKKIEAGEATVWSSEMLVTLGATGEKEQAAQRKREAVDTNQDSWNR